MADLFVRRPTLVIDAQGVNVAAVAQAPGGDYAIHVEETTKQIRILQETCSARGQAQHTTKRGSHFTRILGRSQGMGQQARFACTDSCASTNALDTLATAYS